MAKPNVPNIQRLLGKGESIIYVARQHPLYGWEWFLAALALGIVGVLLSLWLLIPAVGLFMFYLLPFFFFEMAVTTHRFLARQGRLEMAMEEILPIHLDHWDVQQNLLLNLVNGGHINLHLRYNLNIRSRQFYWIHDPLGLIAAMEKLSPSKTREEAEIGKKPELPATVENQENAPHGIKPAPPSKHENNQPASQPRPAMQRHPSQTAPHPQPRKPTPPVITGQDFAPGLKGPSASNGSSPRSTKRQ